MQEEDFQNINLWSMGHTVMKGSLMTDNTEVREKRAVTVGVNTAASGASSDFEVSMKELSGLAEACGYEVVGESRQNLSRIENSTYIGSGKLSELKLFMESVDAGSALFLNTLSPAQLSNLCTELDAEVLDKTGLILNIFGERARSREAKMQVESAKLKYMLPRLSGLRKNLSRQGGTGGSMSNKGSGEKQTELDRRHIEKRLSELRRALDSIDGERETQRRRRQREGIPLVALVGYTNAGKSTLMNKLLETFPGDEIKGGDSEKLEARKVEAKDMLFATLDTTVRRIDPGNGKKFLLSDTVGFIHDLPHELIKAFRSTLEEAKTADLILNVVDYSDENRDRQIRVTEETLKELGAADIPVIYVMNKADKAVDTDEFLRELSYESNENNGKAPHNKVAGELLPVTRGNRIYMSAKTGEGIRELAEMISAKLFEDYMEVEFLIPYEKGGAENELRQKAIIDTVEYRKDGIYIKCSVGTRLLGRYREFVI